ncbi:MAG TPA: DEAD/DEAH box helicase, partial [Sphingomicrobium sp.]|nr:DEAD/DEAH box helicase [Sphingomicrobium sp.]
MTAEEIIAATGAVVVEQFAIAPRPERLAALPPPYATRNMRRWFKKMTQREGKGYTHQVHALEAQELGSNVVLNTGTASGKTLAFLAPIIRNLLDDPFSKALLLYPQKALSADQCKRIRSALEEAGLPSDLVGVINGDVPASERFAIVERCRIILATPDVVQSWVTRNLATPQVRQMLKTLRFLVIDEAHVLEGVFGSNTAFLLRRLLLAVERARAGTVVTPPLQILAASATIRDAAGHMELLTGREFVEIGEADNGAPFHGLTMLHIEGPAYGPSAETYLAHLCGKLAAVVEPHALIGFADTRQGVEHVTRQIGRDDVLPYRGGYDAHDRELIEQALWAGKLRGVISTSALELGVDIPQLPIGLNLGVPQTLKACRQRVGRIGRSMPGVFAIVAPANEFVKLGGSMREFYEGEIEPSRLYLSNPYIQLQAA